MDKPHEGGKLRNMYVHIIPIPVGTYSSTDDKGITFLS